MVVVVRKIETFSFLQNLHQTPTHTSSASGNANTINFNASAYGPQLPDQSSSGDSIAVQWDENQSSQSCLCTSPNEFVGEQDGEYANFKQDLSFPREHLVSLEEKINNPRWVIPVLPGQELQILLDAAIKLCRAGMLFELYLFHLISENFRCVNDLTCFVSIFLLLGKDGKSEACQRFFRDSMSVCINKIMTDEAVGGWKYNIHQCIYDNCLRFIEICALKISEDWLPLLELLALVLNPCNKYVHVLYLSF